MGFLEVLTILFVVLKLVGVIDWSWWAVLSPVILSVSLYVVFTLAWVISLIVAVFKS